MRSGLVGTAASITTAIATRNRPTELRRCLAAVLTGEVLPGEIIVVDQSDDDASWHAIEGFIAAPVHIRYVPHSSRGLSSSRNAAVAHARLPVIAFTDDDCVPDSRWISGLQRAFSGPARPAAVTGRVLPLGPEQPGLYATSVRSSTIVAEYRGRVLPWIVGTGGNTAVQREWLDRIGGFDERLGTGSGGRAAEDTDLLYRLLVSGARIRFDPAVVVFHERHDRARRMASRVTYGYGMSTFCVLSLHWRDPYPLWMLVRWTADRAKLLLKACARGRLSRAHEELLMFRGLAGGLAHGVRLRAAGSRQR